MPASLKAIVILLLILSQSSDYYTLMIQAQMKLAMLNNELETLNSYKFDYVELQKVTENASIAISLINEAQIMHEKGNDSVAIELLTRANNLLDITLKSAQNYITKVEAYNNEMRLIAIFSVPLAAAFVSYISIATYNFINEKRIKRILNCYAILKKHEDE